MPEKPKTAARPARTIRLTRDPREDGTGVFQIHTSKETGFYTFHEILCEIGGRGFAVHRIGLGQMYHVRVGHPEDCSCECLGWLAHGKCKHVSGLLALIKQHGI